MRARHALLALCAGSFVGCARPYLTWAPREPLSARRGKLAIAVEDRRSGDRRSVGRAFGLGGVPREIFIPEGEPRTRLLRLASEAAVTAGLGLAAPAEPPSARLLLGLERLHCDGGGFVASAELNASFAILAPDGSPRLAPESVSLRGKGSGCDRAFADTLDQLLDELAARLVNGPAHEAALASERSGD